jgi:F420-0:gamma-glutamyl ligase
MTVLHTEARVGTWSRVRVAGTDYLRLPLHTRWLTEADDLVASLKKYLGGFARPGDTVAVSEKVVVLLTGRTVDIGTVQPGRLARLLAGHVHCRTDSRGLSVPEKMEYVVRTIGSGRVLAAAVGGALTRPLGMRGTFYRMAGSVARDIDGGRPPYEDLLFPPLETAAAQQICTDLEQALGIGVSIVDLNDFGGSIRAVSAKSPPAATLAAVLEDNPMGQRRRSTPFVIVRELRDLNRHQTAAGA